jgi:hypothetical protein
VLIRADLLAAPAQICTKSKLCQAANASKDILVRAGMRLILKCDEAAQRIHEKVGVGKNLAKRGIIFLGK